MPAQGQGALRTRGLGRRFGAVEALKGLDLDVAEGEIFGLVGPDGAGKTTTLRLLTAILPPTAGEAWVDGLSVTRDAEALKARIGYMSQRFGLYPDLTVTENLDFYADLYGLGREGRTERMERLLAFSQLAPFRRRLAGNLSGGMKQKLGLACALIHTPRILFLDEPTNGVDPVSRRDFWRILTQLLKEKVTILVSTAYLDEAERCGRVGLLHEGRLLACDTVDKVKAMMQGTLLEIRCAEPRRALPRLRAAGLLSATLHGDRIHAAVPEADAGRQAAERVLREAGIASLEIAVAEPSLEDVFLSAIPESSGDGGRA